MVSFPRARRNFQKVRFSLVSNSAVEDVSSGGRVSAPASSSRCCPLFCSVVPGGTWCHIRGALIAHHAASGKHWNPFSALDYLRKCRRRSKEAKEIKDVQMFPFATYLSYFCLLRRVLFLRGINF